jgi:hypothetical protein
MQMADQHGRSVAEVAAAAQHMSVVRALLEAHTRCSVARARGDAMGTRREGQRASHVGGHEMPKAEVLSPGSPELAKMRALRGYPPPLLHSVERSVAAGSVFNRVHDVATP